MVGLCVQQSFWSVFRKLMIDTAVHEYVISKSPCTTENLCQKHICQHASWVTWWLPDPKWWCVALQTAEPMQTPPPNDCFAKNIFVNMHHGQPDNCQIPSDGVLLYKQQNLCKLHPQMIVLFAKAAQEQLKSLQNSNVNFPQTHSWWNIWSHGHQVNTWNDWLGYCCQLSNLPPLSSFKFQFSPQRCDRQNVNEKLLHLFFSKIMRFITGYTLVNICDSFCKVKE